MGFPCTEGEPDLLPLRLYKEEALRYLMTVENKKRYLVGPWLAKELTGVAKVAIRTKTTQDPQRLSHPRGTYQLLEFLEDFLAKPTLVESSRYIMKFFYNLRRKRGETMTERVARRRRSFGGQPGHEKSAAQVWWKRIWGVRPALKRTARTPTRSRTRAIRGQFDTATVAKALREQWSDDEPARGDKAKPAAAACCGLLHGG